MSYIKSILWILLLIISSCDTKLPDGVKACSDDININCYLKVINKKDCFIHLDTYSGENNIEWSGACVAFLTEGKGKLLFKQSSFQKTSLKGIMRTGEFVGKRKVFMTDAKRKCKTYGTITENTMDSKMVCDNGISVTAKYQRSTECEKSYVNCWKGTFSRLEKDDPMYLVGYMYDPKPYKGKSVMYGVLYWKNTCTEVEWVAGEGPLPTKIIIPPLIDAVKKIQYSRVKSLLADNHPVDFPDKNGRTPLMYAVSRKGMVSETITQLLLQHGADISKKDKKGKTAYDYIGKHTESDNFKMMLDKIRDGKKLFFLSIDDLKEIDGDFSRLPELIKKKEDGEEGEKK